MTRRKAAGIGAGIVFVALVSVFLAKSTIRQVTVGDYEFTLRDVVSVRHQLDPFDTPAERREVWVTVQVERTKAYTSEWRTRYGESQRSLYPIDVRAPDVIPDARFVAPDGTQLPLVGAYEASEPAPWNRLVGSYALRTGRHQVRFEFDNSAGIHQGTFSADVRDGHEEPNTMPNPRAWPVVGRLRFANIHIP